MEGFLQGCGMRGVHLAQVFVDGLRTAFHAFGTPAAELLAQAYYLHIVADLFAQGGYGASGFVALQTQVEEKLLAGIVVHFPVELYLMQVVAPRVERGRCSTRG